MKWQNYITADSFVCEGRACFQDIQIMVSSVLEKLANGMMPNDIQKKYPSLNQPCRVGSVFLLPTMPLKIQKMSESGFTEFKNWQDKKIAYCL